MSVPHARNRDGIRIECGTVLRTELMIDDLHDLKREIKSWKFGRLRPNTAHGFFNSAIYIHTESDGFVVKADDPIMVPAVFYIRALVCSVAGRVGCGRCYRRYRLGLVRVILAVWTRRRTWLPWTNSSIVRRWRWKGRVWSRRDSFHGRWISCIRRWRVGSSIVEGASWRVLIQLLLSRVWRLIARWIWRAWRHDELSGQKRLHEEKLLEKPWETRKTFAGILRYFARCCGSFSSWRRSRGFVQWCHISLCLAGWSWRAENEAGESACFAKRGCQAWASTKSKWVCSQAGFRCHFAQPTDPLSQWRRWETMCSR